MFTLFFGGSPSTPTIPPPPPPPDTNNEDELDRLARQRESLRRRSANRQSLRIDPAVSDGTNQNDAGVQIP